MSEKLTPKIIEALSTWFQLAKENGYDPGAHGNLGVQIQHSSLLRRLLEGKCVFKYAPPKSFSYPWIELIEHGKTTTMIHRDYWREDDWHGRPGPWLFLNQTPWLIVEEGDKWCIADSVSLSDRKQLKVWRIKVEIRDTLVTDGFWSSEVSPEDREKYVRESNEKGDWRAEVTLLNPLSDREEITFDSF
jgi:hypothetical protein